MSAHDRYTVATANSEADSNRETHSCPRVRGLGRDMVDDLVWAYRQSDDFMLHFMSRLPCCFCLRRMDMEMLREEARWVRWNPVFPFAVLGCVICMALGKWFHAVFRQGTKVRDDESDLERRVRTWWVYTYSGGFVCTSLLDLLDLVTEQPSGHELEGYLLSLLLSLTYMLGNVNFLHQMRHRQTLLVRVSAIAKMSYGVCFLLVCILAIVRQTVTMQTRFQASYLAWILRSFFAVMMLLAFCGYWKILFLRYHEEEEPRQERIPRHVQAALITLSALYPLVLVTVSFMFGGQDLWQGLVGA